MLQQVIDAQKELDSIEKEKESVLLDCKRLSVEKIQSLEEIKKYKLMRDDFKNKYEKSKKDYESLAYEIDILVNKINDLNAQAKHVSDNADAKTIEANKLMEDAISQLSLLRQEKINLKENSRIFDQKIKDSNIKEFDYKKAYEDLENTKIYINNKSEKIEKDRLELDSMRTELNKYIEINKKAIADLNYEIKDSKLKKSNWVDAMGKLREESLENAEQKKANEKEAERLKIKIAQADEYIKAQKRNLDDMKNRENELKLKQLKFEKLLKEKNMLEELKQYEESLK